MQKNIPFVEEPLTDELIERFKADGHMSAPVVVAGDQTWAGFRHSQLQALARR